VLSGGSPGPHRIQGIRAGFISYVRRLDLVDEIIKVTGDNAIATARRLAKGEGILVGVSSGAIVLGPITIERGAKIGAGSVVIRPVPLGATAVGVPARIAKPQLSVPEGQLDHNKLPDPMLRMVSQILDRLSRLEEKVQAQRSTSEYRTSLQKTVPKKEEQIYSRLKQVIDMRSG
jgi:serine O-acetyltransferase